MTLAEFNIPFEVAPFKLGGRVYGALLNHRSAVEAVADLATQPPYMALPRAPVLFIKPRNTLALCNDVIEVPSGVEELEVAGTLGLVIGRSASRVSENRALEYIAGYLIVNDVSVPHASYHRPSVRQKARDGFCPLGPWVTPRQLGGDPDALTVRTYIDDELVQSMSTAQLSRSTRLLLTDVTDFMSLSPGDVLAVGAAAPAPRARAGQRVDIEIDGLGRLSNQLVQGGE